MSLRFICPHCRVAVDPEAMEVSHSQCAELRVCPCCDTPVVLAARGGRDAPRPDFDACSPPSAQEAGNDSVDAHHSSEAAT